MRSVSFYPFSAYKHNRVIDKKICSIIKKDFDANKLNLPRQSYEKTYTANGLIDIVSKKNLEVNGTTHGKNTLAFLTNQVYMIDIDDKIQLKMGRIFNTKRFNQKFNISHNLCLM